ncbi:MAG: MBL fold metallo-hydrolase [Planctomycetes bacterium]|nr:MBL fold metallo-hydrolase [Planctomycetota bacterium]
MKVIMLGTGTSHGIPMIACDCEVCTSDDPRDRRTRPSIHVQHNGIHILVDTAPELRLQCLAGGIRRADAVLFTHHHADHVTGLDDLRRFNWLQNCTLKCYAQEEDITAIRRMFAYAFVDDPEYPSHKPDLDFIPIDGPIELTRSRRLQPARSPDEVQSTDSNDPAATCTVLPIPLIHGPTPVLGFRFDNFAYCTDCSYIPDDSMKMLEGLDVLILDALRRRPHPTHFNLEEAVEWAGRIGAKQTYFTHIAHELLHAKTNSELPPNMQLGHDGQVIEL